MDKYDAIAYIINNNPVCEDCVRADLEQVRIAAGLYQLLKEIISVKSRLIKGKVITRITQAPSCCPGNFQVCLDFNHTRIWINVFAGMVR